MKNTIQIVAALILLSGCMNKEPYGAGQAETRATVAYLEPKANTQHDEPAEEKSKDEGGFESRPATGGASSTPATFHEVDKKTPLDIIRNASIRFQVKDIEKSHQKIAELLKQNNSYFGSDNKETNTYNVSDNMNIRVPAQNFDKLLNEMMEESVYTNYKNITAEDVTAEYVDIETRLKNKKEVEQRYLVLLKQAIKVPDIIEVEDKLRMLREEIESSEGRLKLMKDQVTYSTITLNIYQKLDYTPEPEIGFISNLKEAFISGWRNLVAFFVAMVRVWPFVIIIGSLLFFFIGKLRRKRAKS